MVLEINKGLKAWGGERERGGGFFCSGFTAFFWSGSFSFSRNRRDVGTFISSGMNVPLFLEMDVAFG